MMAKNAEKFWIAIGATVGTYICSAYFNILPHISCAISSMRVINRSKPLRLPCIVCRSAREEHVKI